jgi:dTDP-4-amino-4,6-dideoxygalactose transaminase
MTSIPKAIPFCRPYVSGKELNLVAAVVESGHFAGPGPFGRKCEQLLSNQLRGASVLLTPSCTHALEMAALLADIGPGDEVIMPSFTFVSSANAFVLRGATPVFVDLLPGI